MAIMDVTNLEIQRQLAHDIRSPLSILELLVGTLDHVSEEQQQLFQMAHHFSMALTSSRFWIP